MPLITFRLVRAGPSPGSLGVQPFFQLADSQRVFGYVCPGCQHPWEIEVDARNVGRMDRYYYPTDLPCFACRSVWVLEGETVIGSPGGQYVAGRPLTPGEVITGHNLRSFSRARDYVGVPQTLDVSALPPLPELPPMPELRSSPTNPGRPPSRPGRPRRPPLELARPFMGPPQRTDISQLLPDELPHFQSSVTTNGSSTGIDVSHLMGPDGGQGIQRSKMSLLFDEEL